MNSKENIDKVAQREINLSLSIGAINKILTALGHLPYNQVYGLIQNIRAQTELALDINSSGLDKETHNYEHSTTNR